MRLGEPGLSYRAGGFILHPIFLGLVLVGAALWLGLFFAFGTAQGVTGAVVAVVLVVLGLSLVVFVGMFVFLDVTFAVIARAVSRAEQHKRDSRTRGTGDAWVFYYGFGMAALFAVPGVFAFGYMAGGAVWGLYAVAATVCFLAVSAALHARR